MKTYCTSTAIMFCIRKRIFFATLALGCVIAYSSPSFGAKVTQGTGFFFGPDGMLFTNKRVANYGCNNISIKITGNRTYSADIVYLSERHDLAILKTVHSNKYHIFLRVSKDYKRVRLPIYDEMVNTIGFPKGPQKVFGGLVVVAQARSDSAITIINIESSLLSSGSPIFDMNGLLIGITTKLLGVGQKKYAGLTYALNGRAINDAVREAGVRIGTSSVVDSTLEKMPNLSLSDKIDRILYHGHLVIVEVFCFH